MSSTSSTVWAETTHAILSRLDIRGEAESLGVRFAARHPGASGWIACHAVGRDDATPSASLNIASANGELGRYRDHGPGGSDKSISFFDMAARCGRFSDFLAAREYYAGKTGVELPGRAKTSTGAGPLMEKVTWIKGADDALQRMVDQWASRKPGVTAADAVRGGARTCKWPRGKYAAQCLAFIAVDPADLLTPTALLLYRVDGQDFPPMSTLAARKTHLVGGSHDGLIIVGTADEFRAAETLWKCEGVTDALSLAPRLPSGHVAFSNACGAKGCPKNIDKAVTDKRLYVCHDADQAGMEGAAKFARATAGSAAEVRIVRLPYDMQPDHGKDLRDFFTEGHSIDELLRLAEQAELVEPAEKQTDDDGRPEIEITADEHLINDQAIAALAVDETLFERGGALVHVVRAGGLKKGILLPDGSPRIVPVEKANLRERLARAAVFVMVANTEDGESKKRKHVPGFCSPAILARGQWSGIRPLEGVTDCPLLRPDGSILDAPGYDPATGMIYEPTINFPSISEKPSLADAQAAIDQLYQIVADFPFAEASHCSAWIASALTPLARLAFEGPSPLFLADANVRGSGKSMLVDLVSILATGRDAPRTAPPPDDAECRKMITSVAMGGDRLLLIDNVETDFGWASLDAVLTSNRWKDRLLGFNLVIDVPMNTVWYATGNNVSLKGDASRRILHIRLHSKLENPEERDGFRIENIKAWTLENRGRLVSAALTVLRAYFIAGRPRADLPPWGSFEGWSNLVRQALVWAGCHDPGSTRKELVKRADRVAGGLAQLIDALDAVDPEKAGLTSSEIAALVAPDAWGNCRSPDLKNAIAEICPTTGDKPPSSGTIGKKLGKLRARYIGDRAIDAHDDDHKARWFVFQNRKGE